MCVHVHGAFVGVRSLEKGDLDVPWYMKDDNLDRAQVGKLWSLGQICLQPINKVLLENSYAHSFTYHLWLFLYYKNKTEQLWQRPNGPQFLNYLLPTLYRKSLPTPNWEQR